MAAVLFCTAIGTLLMARMARRVARPILVVAAQARGLAEGDLSTRSRPLLAQNNSMEIEQLSSDFDLLASRLEKSEAKLREDSAAIAHELRTPLMIMQGRLEAMIDGVFDPSRDEYMRLLVQTKLLGRIVGDLSLLSLARADRLNLMLERVNLAAIASEALQNLSLRLAEQEVRVETSLAAAWIDGDYQRIVQCVTALVDNAIRYAGEARELRVETTQDERHAALRVLDRGPGLTADLHATVFEAFVRGDPSRSRERGGTGLGLAVVRAIVERHKGAVTALPRLGGGAIFEIRLPVSID